MATRKASHDADGAQRSAKKARTDKADQAAPSEAVPLTDAPGPSTHRREALFLGDTELFAFDFGGAATAVASFEDEEAQQTIAAKQIASQELATVTATLMASSSADTAKRTALTHEQVTQCATAARQTPLSHFFFFPGPRTGKHRTRVVPDAAKSAQTETLSIGTLPRQEGDEVATLADALTYFENGLRTYDESLWRAHKAKREEERAKRKRQRQRTA